MKTLPRLALLACGALVSLALLAACAAQRQAEAPTDASVLATLKSSFREKGQAKLDRLDQDDTQRQCSRYAGKPLPADVARGIEQVNLQSIRYPVDGQLIGDWKNGEKIAQEGRGKQFSDDPAGPVGANCYACHQLAPQELSYGTIGPSLAGFGKTRGFTAETARYAYGKIFNAEAFAACSNMPRFGHSGILTEQQIKDLTALLVDPKSPVNQ